MSKHAAQNEQVAVDDRHPESMVRRLSRTLADLSGQTESRALYYKRASAEVVRAFNSPYGAVSVRLGSEVVEDYWHQGSTDPGFWKGPIEQVLNDSLEGARAIARQFTSKDAKFHIAILSVLLRDVGGSMIGVLSLVARCDRAEDAGLHRELLESIAAQMALGAARVEARASAPKQAKPGDELSKASRYRTSAELAFALVSSVRNKFGCEQAAIGVAQGAKVRIVAVSGLDEVGHEGTAVRMIRDAMGEAVDAGHWIASSSANSGSFRVHRRWHEDAGRSPVASVPLPGEENTTLVVSLRRAGDAAFTEEELEQASALLAPYAPAFTLIDRASRTVVRHVTQALKASALSVVQPGRWGRKALLAACLGGGLWIAFGTVTHSVSASAVLLPAQTRHIAAPATGMLEAVLVAPGDEVKQGQLLAQLDTSDLLVERTRLQAEIEIARINEDRALAQSASADAALARAERRRASARLDEVHHHITQASITAPFDGRVVAGDMRSRVGEALTMGEPLFEVADTSAWVLEVAVPQRIAADLDLGQTGVFAPGAKPEEVRGISVTRVKPLPELRAGKSVYVAEADLTENASWLRPGMEGAARINLGERAVWWVMSHRTIDYFRMNFWL